MRFHHVCIVTTGIEPCGAVLAGPHGFRCGRPDEHSRRRRFRPRHSRAAEAQESPEGFSFYDLRHYLASLLIAWGADIKTVQARMRHATARTTLDTYGHLWPDADESTRTTIGAVIAERMDSAADPLRSQTPDP
jgi:integrase